MASRGQKLDLQDCLLDTPKVHSQVAHFEAGLVPFREYVTLLRDTFQACHLHQEKVGEGARAISNLLVNIDSELGERAGSTSSSVFSQLSRYQTELYSCQEMFNSQLQNSVVHRMSALLEEDIDHLLALKDTYDNSRQEHEHAMAKFSRTSKRRDSDKARFEANAELYAARKKFYQCTLDYISQLKEFQMRRRFMLLEPVLTFMHAQMGYFKACQEIMNSGFQQLLTNLNGDIQSYHSEHENEVRELQQQKTELELQFPTLCVPDPDLSDPFTEFPTPNTGLSSRYGYLYLRVQKGGLAAKWERTFFFTKNGYLYTQSLQKNAEALLQLKEADAFASDCDDKRYVMQISHPALKKPVFLQAESDTQRTEWISVIRNNSVRKSQHGESLGNQTHDGARLRTRLYDSLERERIRSWASKELNQEPGSSRAAPSLPPSSVKPSSLGGGLKGATPPQRRPKSPLRSQKTATSSQQTNPETNSRATKSPQRSFSLLGLGSGNSGEKKSPSPRPPSLSSSKMAEVQNWVHSTNAATAMAQSLNHSPPSGELVVKFPVKYLGQKEVVEPKNPSTISGTIRGVITARAVKKVKPATSIELAIQLKKITLIETQSNKAIGKFLLKDIINCAVHPEDEKLFGVVCRVVEPERVKYVCHVMQADQSGSKVAGAISEAIQKLWRMMQGREGGGQRSGTDKKQV
ncbi:DCC-interacting protein 13-alpha [Geodia barretti]|uniref:DCC-interacting protein 13-alpha n=1 Tax=Geodia barretti TaxID=519541 RepID=A0AA35QWI5_GEOBA|nr:DCC-interacting protein 13-alpha [Geodia barretti]